jgi:hypothetical protein
MLLHARCLGRGAAWPSSHYPASTPALVAQWHTEPLRQVSWSWGLTDEVFLTRMRQVAKGSTTTASPSAVVGQQRTLHDTWLVCRTGWPRCSDSADGRVVPLGSTLLPLLAVQLVTPSQAGSSHLLCCVLQQQCLDGRRRRLLACVLWGDIWLRERGWGCSFEVGSVAKHRLAWVVRRSLVGLDAVRS